MARLPPIKPANPEQYRQWLCDERNITISSRTEIHYATVVQTIKNDFEKSDFWRQFTENQILRDFNEAYQLKHGNYPLTQEMTVPKVLTKSFESFFLKTFRKNVLDNSYWPDPPKVNGKTEWVLPKNWFEKINDIVRMCFVVKYLDGVQYLAQKIEELCQKYEINCSTQMEAREQGYYARICR